MRIMKALERLEELAKKESEIEARELQRRNELMLRLIKSRNNNLKLLNLSPKGDNFC